MRIGTFNIENLTDEPPTDDRTPSFDERAAILRLQLDRMRADILCLQEVHGQDVENAPRELRALRRLLEGTRYEAYDLRSTRLANGRDVEKFRNLVTLVAPGFMFEETREILHDYAPAPQYNFVTDDEATVRDIKWDRPLLYTRLRCPDGCRLHVLNAHFKSKIPTTIPGQKINNFTWRTAGGWAEGFFVSSMKRVGAALEARLFVDALIAQDQVANVVICGDLNAEAGDVPLQALRGEVEDTQNPELNPFTLYPCENSVPEDQRFTLYHHGRKTMLDHILVSRAMMGRYLGTEIHNEIVRDESVAFAFDKKFPASDHAPVIASFGDLADHLSG
jgi:predicted extracellular nuclease